MENKELILYTEKTVNKDSRQITAAVSSEAIDRDDEIVTAAAMKAAMPKFMENPVILAAHTHRTSDGTSPVIGRVVSWKQQGAKTFCEIEFADTPLGTQYHTLYAEKYQRAFSIGFHSLKTENRNIGRKSVLVHTEIELYEISAVAVPANPEALSKAKKSRVDFVQRKRDNLTPYEKIVKYNPEIFDSAIEKMDDFSEGRVSGLTQDELIVCRHLEKQGIEFAEALFSPEFDNIDFSDMEAGGPTSEKYFEGMECLDGDEFDETGKAGKATEPDYAAIFKK